jgi:hypothetical protein
VKLPPPLPKWYVTYETVSGDRHGQWFWTELAAVNFACDARKPKVEHRGGEGEAVPLTLGL